MKTHIFIPTLSCSFGCELWPLMGELSVDSSSLLSQTYNLVGKIDGEVNCDAVGKENLKFSEDTGSNLCSRVQRNQTGQDLNASR